jgi:dienelactone hydrolase
MKNILIIFISILLSFALQAQVNSRTIDYQQGDTQLQGILYYDPILKSKRGGILILHDENGQSDFIKEKAQSLAAAGYVVFTADLFGKEVKEPKTAAGQLNEDRALLLERARAGLDQLVEQSTVDPTRVATIGYALGGTAALELARSGVDLKATACFYGNLKPMNPGQAYNIRGIVLIFLGAKDSAISEEEIASFKEEMNSADVDWQLNLYGNAGHSFANPQAGDDITSGSAYNYHADKRSGESLKAIFFMLLK